VKRSVRRHVLQLAELGWLHNQVRHYCENAEASRTLGVMGRSLIAAFRAELNEYYRLVAILESQVRFYHIICIRLLDLALYVHISA
jgi:hypothetical protein